MKNKLILKVDERDKIILQMFDYVVCFSKKKIKNFVYIVNIERSYLFISFVKLVALFL